MRVIIEGVSLLILVVVWFAWIVDWLYVWAKKVFKSRHLTGWDRIGLFASIVCLVVGFWYASSVIERESGRMANSALGEMCYEREQKWKVPFSDCWTAHKASVDRHLDGNWFVPPINAVLWLGMAWSIVLVGGWLWRGFRHRAPPPASR